MNIDTIQTRIKEVFEQEIFKSGFFTQNTTAYNRNYNALNNNLVGITRLFAQRNPAPTQKEKIAASMQLTHTLNRFIGSARDYSALASEIEKLEIILRDFDTFILEDIHNIVNEANALMAENNALKERVRTLELEKAQRDGAEEGLRNQGLTPATASEAIVAARHEKEKAEDNYTRLRRAGIVFFETALFISDSERRDANTALAKMERTRDSALQILNDDTEGNQCTIS